MEHPRYAVLLWAVTAGSQGESLGSDETDTVAIGWCVVDLANIKVSEYKRKIIFAINDPMCQLKLCPKHTDRKKCHINMWH